jgi:CDK-activating kinase assembly factor MAT1
VLAGGYDIQEYYSRTMLEAFAGLGCFIDEEVPQREVSSFNAMKPIGTEGTALAAGSESSSK